MSASKDPYTIFEDQDDYIEDIKDQIRVAIKRYTLYSKMFGHPSEWKHMRQELKQFMNYETEKMFSMVVIRETMDGCIKMEFPENPFPQ